MNPQMILLLLWAWGQSHQLPFFCRGRIESPRHGHRVRCVWDVRTAWALHSQLVCWGCRWRADRCGRVMPKHLLALPEVLCQGSEDGFRDKLVFNFTKVKLRLQLLCRGGSQPL